MMRRKRRTGCLLLFGWLAQGLGMAAECELQLETEPVEWQGGPGAGYNVFDPAQYPQTINFKVHLTGDPCAYFVTFSQGSGGAGGRAAILGGDTVAYELYDSVESRTILKDLPSAGADEVLHGEFAAGETVKDMSYAVVVSPLQIRPPGTYTDTFDITVYEGTPGNAIQKDSRSVSLSISVPDTTELSLVNNGAPFDPHAKARELDFDRLTEGKRLGFDMRVRSNTQYRIILESENGGVMKNVDSQATTTIPYALEIGGAPVNLSGGVPADLSRGSSLTDSNGDSHDFEVIIGDVGGAMAGTYRDSISITVISND